MPHPALKTLGAIATGLLLSACDRTPSQDETDPTVDAVLMQKDADKQAGKYFIIESEGVQKGVVHIKEVFTKENGDHCARYSAFTARDDAKNDGADSIESNRRTRCIPALVLKP